MFFFVLVIQLNALLGKRGRQLKDLNDYWEVATYFELHSVQNDWPKACQAALHMYLVNPPIWYLKSTINNLKILHHARQIRRNRNLLSTEVLPENEIYSFWMEFFCDAINSSSPDERELPNQVPVSFLRFFIKIFDRSIRFSFVIITRKTTDRNTKQFS